MDLLPGLLASAGVAALVSGLLNLLGGKWEHARRLTLERRATSQRLLDERRERLRNSLHILSAAVYKLLDAAWQINVAVTLGGRSPDIRILATEADGMIATARAELILDLEGSVIVQHVNRDFLSNFWKYAAAATRLSENPADNDRRNQAGQAEMAMMNGFQIVLDSAQTILTKLSEPV